MLGEPYWIPYVFGGAALLLAAHLVFRIAGRDYRTYRGPRVIICPETKNAAAVTVDAPHAALTALAGAPELRLKQCSRWPERQDCGQECLRQIEAAPEDCLVRTLVNRWYAGKTCHFCGKPFDEIKWHEHKAALLDPSGQTKQWNDIPAEALPQVLTTHKPVCWNCHINETFRRLNPDLVVERDPEWSEDPERPGRRHQWIH